MDARNGSYAITLFCWILAGFAEMALGRGTVNVAEYHNHPSRDGLYIDPAFTKSAVTNLKRDVSFNGTISGNVYAQPLYIENGPDNRAMIIAVTESNNVYALDAADGTVIWQRQVGSPVALTSLPCGNINPLGISGTPIVDLVSRTLVFDAMTTPDNGTTKKHLIYALNVDTGTTNSGWPVDVGASVKIGTTNFNSSIQNQRSAVGLLSNIFYVTYGGHAGDCSNYFGWVVGVPLTNPAGAMAWATTAVRGGIWGVGGVANDGNNPFVATGNTVGATAWGGGEAIIRLQSGPVFTSQIKDYWAPTNWASLDGGDADIGGSGPLLVDVPGATPSALVVALGKDGNAYLLNRTNLGGISASLALSHLSSTSIIQAAATYRTTNGTYVVFCGNTSANQLTAFRITAANPPAISNIWTVTENGRGSPFVTSTDGTNNVIVWGVGAENDQRLHGFDGDTGSTNYSGGGANELMASTRRFCTGIAARGRIFVAADNKIYAFTLPVSSFLLTNLTMLPGGMFQFGYTNNVGMGFTVFSSTNVSLPLSNWTRLGFASEVSPGHYQFADAQATNNVHRFYRVRAP
jgi:hypothetical protein